jgi:hypothetical protein
MSKILEALIALSAFTNLDKFNYNEDKNLTKNTFKNGIKSLKTKRQKKKKKKR